MFADAKEPGVEWSPERQASFRAMATAFRRGRPTYEQMKALVSLATPLYIELLCSRPYYEAVRNDADFWHSYIMSRPIQALDLLEARWQASLNPPSSYDGEEAKAGIAVSTVRNCSPTPEVIEARVPPSLGTFTPTEPYTVVPDSLDME